MRWEQTLLITVFSDASFKDGIAGWGFWFKSSHGTGVGDGAAPAFSAAHAELLGILAAAAEAVRCHQDCGPLALLIQCDSQAALGAFLHLGMARVARSSPMPISRRKQLAREERDALLRFRAQHPAIPIYLKHVKGHSKNGDARSWVNGYTDKLASTARLAHAVPAQDSDGGDPT